MLTAIVLFSGAYVKGSCYHLWHVTAMAAQLAGVQVRCCWLTFHPFIFHRKLRKKA